MSLNSSLDQDDIGRILVSLIINGRFLRTHRNTTVPLLLSD